METQKIRLMLAALLSLSGVPVTNADAAGVVVLAGTVPPVAGEVDHAPAYSNDPSCASREYARNA